MTNHQHNKNYNNSYINLSKKTRGLDAASINVSEICPERPLPDWIQHRTRKKKSASHKHVINNKYPTTTLSHNTTNATAAPTPTTRIKELSRSFKQRQDAKYLNLTNYPVPALETFDYLNDDEQRQYITSNSARVFRFNGERSELVPVVVNSIHDNKFNVTYESNNDRGEKRMRTKNVSRLNIVFDDEDFVAWERRRSLAVNERDKYKQNLRFNHFVTNFSNDEVSAVSLEEVCTQIANRSMICVDEDCSIEIERVVKLVEEEYILFMKLAVIYDKMETCAVFKKSYEGWNLPQPPIAPFVPERGLHPTPFAHQSFQERKFCLDHVHLFSFKEVMLAFKFLNNTWEDKFDKSSLVYSSEDSPPCSLTEFKHKQSNHATSLMQQLDEGWRKSFAERLLDTLGDIYDFYQCNHDVYESSALFRLLMYAKAVMASSLRKLLYNSLNTVEDIFSVTSVDDSSCPSFVRPLILCELEILCEDKEIRLSPSKAELESTIRSFIGNITVLIESVPNIDSEVMPLLRLKKQSILSFLEENTGLLDSIERCKKYSVQKLIRDFNHAMDLVENYRNYQYLFTTDCNEHTKDCVNNIDESLSDKNEEYSRLENIIQSAQKFHDILHQVKNLSMVREYFGLICVDFRTAKSLLCERAIKLRDSLLLFVSDSCRDIAGDISKEYLDILENLQEIPSGEDEFDDMIRYIFDVEVRIDELRYEVDKLHSLLVCMHGFYYKVAFDTLESIFLLHIYPSKVNLAIQVANKNLSCKKGQMIAAVRKETEQFSSLIQSFQSKLKNVQNLTNFEETEANADKVIYLMDAIEAAEKSLDHINSRESVLGLNNSSFEELHRIKEQLVPFHKLWSISSEFLSSRNEWIHGPFLNIDANIVEQSCKSWERETSILANNFADKNPEIAICVNMLQKELQDFYRYLPSVRTLGSKALKDRHWTSISRVLSVPIELDDELSLSFFVESVGIVERLESIEDIYVSAEKEYGLEKVLDSMIAEWSDIELDLKEYKHTSTFVIGAIDDILNLLDDHIVKVQTMSGSPFIKPIEDRCKNWEGLLKYGVSLLEEWMACQKTWMYLEPIFSSDDIVKQLPMEARRFNSVDVTWRKIMRNSKSNPQFICQADQEKRLYQQLQGCNNKLEEIQKGLTEYLETKRLRFPRFFFLSNEELIEILSQTKEPRAVRPHLNKAFEGIYNVMFEDNLSISTMISGEGEEVTLVLPVETACNKNAGKVEEWLLELQFTHWDTILELVKNSMRSYLETPRSEWALMWPAQVILSVSQVFWTDALESALQQGDIQSNLKNSIDIQNKQLNDIVKLVRGNISKLDRNTLGALLTIDIHARDTTEELVANNVRGSDDFNWTAQMRYYWESSPRDGQAVLSGDKTIMVKMINAKTLYGYEYLGNTSRLVITPLTDRCYRTMLGAIDLLYGGAPEGPAGTGKTETVKDLSKAVAIQCVVFNCSDGLDYLAMAKFFKGLAACGAWCCFDEFNRIDVEVLSVIAQQILQIQNAKRSGLKKFNFEGSYIDLNHNANPFITMNPGYAGRAELPDNLKALFRPCTMMVPDYSLIAEIRLYSFGFEEARPNAQKLVKILQLCSEQCSNQKHYDYGMRAVNSILVAAGNLRERVGKDPLWDENKVVLRSIFDVNIAKFTADDLPLFKGIASDLFPGIELPEANHEELSKAIRKCCLEGVKNFSGELQYVEPEPKFLSKITELYEMVCVRHGICIVGEAGAGKSLSIHALAQAMTFCSKSTSSSLLTTKIYSMNPKAVHSDKLYGRFDENTHEWSDGILAILYRSAAKDEGRTRKWILFDGPVDAIWIENMNTVLDDNKKLCLMSGEIIKMSDSMTMMFETEDLLQASPATVSRLGIVYTEFKNIGWRVLRDVWLKRTLPVMKNVLTHELHFVSELLSELFEWLFPPLMFFISKCRAPITVTEMECCHALIRLLKTFMANIEVFNETSIGCVFIMCITWSIGAIADSDGRRKFSDFLSSIVRNDERLQLDAVYDEFLLKNPSYKTKMKDMKHISIPTPNNASIYDFRYDNKSKDWVKWIDEADSFEIPPGIPLHDILVPTIDTVRNEYIISKLIESNVNVLVTGETGTGKSVTIKKVLSSGLPSSYLNVSMNFSARTKASQAQAMIDSRLCKRRKGIFGPEFGNTMIVFVDDLNMPAKEKYGAQPPIEILRQAIDHCGWYDSRDNSFRQFVDLQYIAAMGLPGGGRSQITRRCSRHYNLINFIPFDKDSMHHIFSTITESHFNKRFKNDIQKVCSSLVTATIDIYSAIIRSLLPTPNKSHYTFNLRDISKVFSGILRAKEGNYCDSLSIIRLWLHEFKRVFFDRLVEYSDQEWFEKTLAETTLRVLGIQQEDIIGAEGGCFLYGSYDPDSKDYVPIQGAKRAKHIMGCALDKYNKTSSGKLVLNLFEYAIEHISRISRIIGAPNENAMLVGLGGSGRKTLSKLASFITGFEVFQPEITKSYNMMDWREDLKKLFQLSGVENRPVVYLLDESQLILEEMLEDISGILNSGEVTNLFSYDEKVLILESITSDAIKEGVNSSNNTELFEYFLLRCKRNRKVILTFPPEQFRSKLRMFPALVNCCTIDWFFEWPQDALYSVANSKLTNVEMSEAVKSGVIECFVNMQCKATELAKQFKSQMNRYYYVTPTSYLRLLDCFQKLFSEQRDIILEKKSRYDNGLRKLQETQEQVDIMQRDLEELRPKLKDATEAADQLLHKIGLDTAHVNEKKVVVEAEEAVCNAQAEKSSALAWECEDDLALALPALKNAIKALKSLSKGDIVEVKSMKSPPAAVKMVMTAVCILMDVKPNFVKDDKSGKKVKDYWVPSQKTLLSDPRFLQNLENYDKDSMLDELVDEVRMFTDDPNFDPEKVKKGSVAASGLCKWVHAMVIYHKVSKEVKPKKEALAKAQAELIAAKEILSGKQAQLKELLDKLNELQEKLNAAERKKKELMGQVEDCSSKLRRAEQLISSLGNEKDRWFRSSQDLMTTYENMVGDIVLSSGTIAYLGAFTSSYRKDAQSLWSDILTKNGVTCSRKFSLSGSLGNQVVIREWIINNLPNDSFSIDNAIMLNESASWPLMIDPELQATRWVKNLEGPNKLKVIKADHNSFARTIENAVQFGTPILIENLGEVLDPILDSLLMKQITISGGTSYVKIGENSVEYDPKFKLYLSTQLPNPHYPPEVCVKVNLLNFMVTPDGLEDQLLSILVKAEEPALETQREELVLEEAGNRKQLQEIEAKILQMLKNSKGNILDDEELIQVLASSNSTSSALQEKLKIAEQTQKRITSTRLIYKGAATHASSLFSCISDLMKVDSMYQFSLNWFIMLYKLSIEAAPQSSDRPTRTKNLELKFTQLIFTNVCRSLFARDKTLFTFLLCMNIARREGSVSKSYLSYLLQGNNNLICNVSNPAAAWMPDNVWKNIVGLSELCSAFTDFVSNASVYLKEWREIYDSADPLEIVSKRYSKSNKFEELLLLRCIRPDSLVPGILHYIESTMGKEYIEAPQADLKRCMEDSIFFTPLVLMITPGSDPVSLLEKLSRDFDKDSTMKWISLGQGQGPAATLAIKDAMRKGNWVCLQNCHLCISWMPTLESLCDDLKGDGVHKNFRLWLTSEPTPFFPSSILKNGLKITIEPPNGVRASLLGTYQSIGKSSFDGCNYNVSSKKLIFALSFFHAIVRERHKYGHIGWNNTYTFSSSDLRISMDQLLMFAGAKEPKDIPFLALNYLTAECNYGGKCTDDKDRRLLANILDDLYNVKLFENEYKFTSCDAYCAPGDLDYSGYCDFIRCLPLNDEPEVFGLNSNANISCAISSTNALLSTALKLQVNSANEDEQGISDSFNDLAAEILKQIPAAFDEEAALMNFPVQYEESMNTVLTQELSRFNILTNTIKKTLEEGLKAYSGLVVMSSELESMCNSIILSHVPNLWSNKAYPSLKSLGPWVKDLIKRLEFFDVWLSSGVPPSRFWISGFFFTQAFITGILQNFARKHSLPIDAIEFDFKVLTPSEEKDANQNPPEDGSYIYGLFLECCSWDRTEHILAESRKRELFSECPYIHLLPKLKNQIPLPKGDPRLYTGYIKGSAHVYQCPLYRTSARWGTLSTTGHSTNFLMNINLPMSKTSSQGHWIKRGAALLTQLND